MAEDPKILDPRKAAKLSELEGPSSTVRIEEYRAHAEVDDDRAQELATMEKERGSPDAPPLAPKESLVRLAPVVTRVQDRPGRAPTSSSGLRLSPRETLVVYSLAGLAIALLVIGLIAQFYIARGGAAP